MSNRIDKTPETEPVRDRLHRLLTAAARHAWDGDVDSAWTCVETAKRLAASERPARAA